MCGSNIFVGLIIDREKPMALFVCWSIELSMLHGCVCVCLCVCPYTLYTDTVYTIQCLCRYRFAGMALHGRHRHCFRWNLEGIKFRIVGTKTNDCAEHRNKTANSF